MHEPLRKKRTTVRGTIRRFVAAYPRRRHSVRYIFAKTQMQTQKRCIIAHAVANQPHAMNQRSIRPRGSSYSSHADCSNAEYDMSSHANARNDMSSHADTNQPHATSHLRRLVIRHTAIHLREVLCLL